METAINKLHSERNATLMAVGVFFGCIGILCIILHSPQMEILKKLADFAAHHYFLTGFVFLMISLVCFKFYYEKNEDYGIRISQKKSRAMKRRILLANLKKRVGFIGNAEESLYI